MAGNLADISTVLGMSMVTLVILFIWSIIWKGIALWRAARNKHLVWFIIILIVNTAGILEILYIFLFSKLHLEEPKAKPRAKKKRR